jgi:hypothetical protein
VKIRLVYISSKHLLQVCSILQVLDHSIVL